VTILLSQNAAGACFFDFFRRSVPAHFGLVLLMHVVVEIEKGGLEQGLFGTSGSTAMQISFGTFLLECTDGRTCLIGRPAWQVSSILEP